MGWQKTFTLAKRSKGCHLVTEEILSHIESGLNEIQIGMLFLFIQHTSAALTINENYDRDVRRDMDMALDNIVPETLNWRHTDEGPDDSVSHTKTSLVGTSISIPITAGRLNLGTWQGIYLTEFRHMPHSRRVVATILFVSSVDSIGQHLSINGVSVLKNQMWADPSHTPLLVRPAAMSECRDEG